MISVDVCIWIFFLVSAYFGVFGLRIIKDSLKTLDIIISILGGLIGFIILLKTYT